MRLNDLLLMSLLAVSGCASLHDARRPVVTAPPQCPPLPEVPAWVLQEPRNLTPLLDQLITPSETDSSSSAAR